MKILALETSAKSVSAAVVENGAVLAAAYQNMGLTHSVTLMPLIDSMLKNAGLTARDMGLIAVAAGPGSFTGLRIGVSAAKGLAWALELPCCGVSTLEAMAENARSFEGTVICAMDARRQQIYNAVFDCHDGALTRQCEDRAASLEVLAEELKNSNNRKIVVGDGAKLCYTYLSEQGIACRMAPPDSLYRTPWALVSRRSAWRRRAAWQQRRSCARSISVSVRRSGSGWQRGCPLLWIINNFIYGG